VIPQDKRTEINDKLLFLVDYDRLDQYGVTKEDVFNSYTGDGGLHGLKYKDYGNYYSYSQAKKEIDNGQYLTPPFIADFLIQCLKPDKEDVIMDLTGGTGVFANSLPVERNFYMNEIDVKAVKIAKCLYPEANITHGDIREYNPKVKADIIVGNPPFNLEWTQSGEKIQSQYYYCLQAYRNLNPGGVLALVVPNSFLNDEFTEKSKIKELGKRFSFLCQFDIPDTYFASSGVQKFSMKIMLFYANSANLRKIPYKNIKTEVNITDEDAFYVYHAYIADHMAKKNKIKTKLFYESLRGDHRWETKKFLEKIKTYLFHIQANPKTENLYASCLQYIEDYKTQKQPEGMKYAEWEKIRKKPDDVIKFLKNALRTQNNPPERDIIELVKAGGSLMMKARSKKTKL
jgi:predicted RNA methylase